MWSLPRLGLGGPRPAEKSCRPLLPAGVAAGRQGLRLQLTLSVVNGSAQRQLSRALWGARVGSGQEPRGGRRLGGGWVRAQLVPVPRGPYTVPPG